MRASISNVSLWAAAAAAVVFAPHLLPDTGGGSGRVLTPYKPGTTPTAELVSQYRDEASAAMSVEEVHIAGSRAAPSGYKVGFAFVKNGKLLTKPRFTMEGADENGARVEIPLSAIESFRLLRVNNRWVAADDADLEVTQFPSLTPAELIAKQPAYSDLVNTYKRTFRINVPVEKDSGSLALVGTNYFSESEYRVISLIRDLEPNSVVRLELDRRGGKGLWWAIESVTKDKAYPHRAIMKK